MKKQTKTGCLFCDGVVDEFYDPIYWTSHAECYKCGTTWEKMYDEYDLINMRITRGYGYVCYVDKTGNVERSTFTWRPETGNVNRLVQNMNAQRETLDLSKSYVFFKEDNLWMRVYGNQRSEVIF